MGVQMSVCPPVGMWRANGNPNPYTDLDEIFTHIPKKVLVQVWPQLHPPEPGGGLKHKNMKETFLKTVSKSKDVQQVAN